MPFQKGHKGYRTKESYQNPEYRKKLSENNGKCWLDKNLPKETKEKMSKTAKKNGFGRWNKGKHNSLKTEFKKEQEAWNKGKKCPQFTGENHWNWKNGKTPENVKVRNTTEYKAWRLDIYQRDWFTCQMSGCGYKGKDIEAHHIRKYENYPELLLKKENGITLCKDCHLLVRGKEKEFEQLFIDVIQRKLNELRIMK